LTYSVKEIFYTLQGEGMRAGRPAVFCRFTGCNLWTGREKDRSQAICKFCDTDFVGTDGSMGGKFEAAEDLASRINEFWPVGYQYRYVVLTGGEPLLQVDSILIDALHKLDFEIAVETNGTIPAPEGIDWLCVSPKAGAPWLQRSGDELKLVYPQNCLSPEDLEFVDFRYYLIQPMDGPSARENTELAINYCKSNPRWQLSIQTHKILSIR
jgi:7-carboxy-7-deazaguanine synthase